MVLSKKTTVSINYWLWQGENTPAIKLFDTQQHTNESNETNKINKTNPTINYNIWISPKQQVLQTFIPENLNHLEQQNIAKNTFELTETELTQLHWQNFLWNDNNYVIGIEPELVHFLQQKSKNNISIDIPWLCLCENITTSKEQILALKSVIYEQKESPFFAIVERENQKHYRLISQQDYEQTQAYWQLKIIKNEFTDNFVCDTFSNEFENIKSCFNLSNLTAKNTNNSKNNQINNKNRLFVEKTKFQQFLSYFKKGKIANQKSTNNKNVINVISALAINGLENVFQHVKIFLKPLIVLLLCNVILFLFLKNSTAVELINHGKNHKKIQKHQKHNNEVILIKTLETLQEQEGLNLQEIKKINCDESTQKCTLFFENQNSLIHFQQKIKSSQNNQLDFKIL